MKCKALTRDKDQQALIIEYQGKGWEISKTEGGHVMWLAPDKRIRPIYSSSTPSDHRATRNLRAMLRAAERST